MNILRENPNYHSIYDLRENLIDMNIGDHTFIDSADGTVFAMGNKNGLHIPKTVYMKFNQLVQQYSFLEIGHIPMENLWFALMGDQLVWSNQPIDTGDAKNQSKPVKLSNIKKKNYVPKVEFEPEPKKFNRYTALINEKKEKEKPAGPVKRKIQWKD